MPEPEPLPVHVSRPELHTIETVDTYQSAGPFTVAITNHGRAAHVHLKLGDDLAQVASLPDSNFYVETDETVRVRVDVSPGGGPVTGDLRIQTGYGAETADVAVTVGHQAREIDVDESLGSPDPDAGDAAEPGETEQASVEVPDPTMPDGILQVAALAVLAVAIAAATVVYVDSIVVVAGVVVVLAAVLVAAVILLR